MRLVAATHNKGKLLEIRAIFGSMGFDVIGQDEAGITVAVEETGATFAENAVLKAKTIAQIANAATIADDSGLCVDALGGEPGVYSARYAGEGATADMLIAKLLANMACIDKPNRTAHFVSAVALCFPEGGCFTAEGRVDGRITAEPCGSGGFGYDPVFFSDELGKTFAEANADEKNRISHRFRALSALRDTIKNALRKDIEP